MYVPRETNLLFKVSPSYEELSPLATSLDSPPTSLHHRPYSIALKSLLDLMSTWSHTASITQPLCHGSNFFAPSFITTKDSFFHLLFTFSFFSPSYHHGQKGLFYLCGFQQDTRAIGRRTCLRDSVECQEKESHSQDSLQTIAAPPPQRYGAAIFLSLPLPLRVSRLDTRFQDEKEQEEATTRE